MFFVRIRGGNIYSSLLVLYRGRRGVEFGNEMDGRVSNLEASG